jgi:hypothetical protein
MTLLQSLRNLSIYPTPSAVLNGIAEECGIKSDAELTPELRASAEYKRAIARTYVCLAKSPNVTQNGISFSFSSEERKHFKAEARQLLKEIGDDPAVFGLRGSYGYKGSDF